MCLHIFIYLFCSRRSWRASYSWGEAWTASLSFDSFTTPFSTYIDRIRLSLFSLLILSSNRSVDIPHPQQGGFASFHRIACSWKEKGHPSYFGRFNPPFAFSLSLSRLSITHTHTLSLPHSLPIEFSPFPPPYNFNLFIFSSIVPLAFSLIFLVIPFLMCTPLPQTWFIGWRELVVLSPRFQRVSFTFSWSKQGSHTPFCYK